MSRKRLAGWLLCKASQFAKSAIQRVRFGVDDEVGPEPANIEVGSRRERGHRCQTGASDHVHRIGVEKRTDWRDVATQFGELAERKHAEVRQRLVLGEPEFRADLGLTEMLVGCANDVPSGTATRGLTAGNVMRPWLVRLRFWT